MKQNAAKTNMIRVASALKIIQESVSPIPCETVELVSLLGRVLAEDIYADINIPQLDNSAMDGYAVRAADTAGASSNTPKVLRVIDTEKAGHITDKILKPGEAIQIMTGAVIPGGADSIVIVEHTERESEAAVKIFKEAAAGDHIRRSGEDIKKGELVLKKGTLLTPAHIGILASVGKKDVCVSRRPKIGILVTGDEVVDVNAKLEPGKLRSSNTYSLYTQALECGCIPKNIGFAEDDPAEIKAKIQKGLDCDIIVTSGGVSAGEYDFVKDVLKDLGAEIKFWKVHMRPGKPVLFAMLGKIPVFGLPGNPVSSMVSFEVFVRIAVLAMLGQREDTRKQVEAILEEDIEVRKGLRHFLRANTRVHNNSFYTRTTGPQGSGILKSMMLANSLIILPEERSRALKDERVTVLLF